MWKLIQLLIWGHVHEYEDLGEVRHFLEDSTMPYKCSMNQRCKICGRFRSIRKW